MERHIRGLNNLFLISVHLHSPFIFHYTVSIGQKSNFQLNIFNGRLYTLIYASNHNCTLTTVWRKTTVSKVDAS